MFNQRGDLYIGSSVRVEKRISEHLGSLAAFRHYNPRVRKAHAVEELRGELIEECKAHELRDREQHHIDTLRPNLNLERKVSRDEATGGGAPPVVEFRKFPKWSQDIDGKFIAIKSNLTATTVSEWLMLHRIEHRKAGDVYARVSAEALEALRRAPIPIDARMDGRSPVVASERDLEGRPAITSLESFFEQMIRENGRDDEKRQGDEWRYIERIYQSPKRRLTRSKPSV